MSSRYFVPHSWRVPQMRASDDVDLALRLSRGRVDGDCRPSLTG